MAALATGPKRMPPDVAGRVKLVFVTTDPARDTPAALRRWLDRFDTRFIGLTGTEAAIETVQRAAGVPSVMKSEPVNGNYTLAHANFVIAYSQGNLAHLSYPGRGSKDDWVHDLPLLVQETLARP